MLAASRPLPRVGVVVEHPGHDKGHRVVDHQTLLVHVQAALLVVVMRHVEHVAELVSDGEGGREAIVLDNGTAVLVAHGAQLGQTQGITVLGG